MPLLSTFMNTGVSCLALGLNCFAHSLPTTPDFATFINLTGSQTSVGNLSTRGTTTVQYLSPAAVGAESCFFAFPSPIR